MQGYGASVISRVNTNIVIAMDRDSRRGVYCCLVGMWLFMACGAKLLVSSKPDLTLFSEWLRVASWVVLAGVLAVGSGRALKEVRLPYLVISVECGTYVRRSGWWPFLGASAGSLDEFSSIRVAAQRDRYGDIWQVLLEWRETNREQSIVLDRFKSLAEASEAAVDVAGHLSLPCVGGERR